MSVSLALLLLSSTKWNTKERKEEDKVETPEDSTLQMSTPL